MVIVMRLKMNVSFLKILLFSLLKILNLKFMTLQSVPFAKKGYQLLSREVEQNSSSAQYLQYIFQNRILFSVTIFQFYIFCNKKISLCYNDKNYHYLRL